MRQTKNTARVAQFADMFSAMGTEARLRIMQLLLTAHPEGLVVSNIQDELEIPNSTLSHHLDKLKTENLRRSAPGGNVFTLYGEYGRVAGVAPVSLRRMLYAEQCRFRGGDRSNLQVGVFI